MPKLSTQIEIPHGFIYQDEAKVSKKLLDFKTAGKDKIHFLLDFDGTITTYEHNGQIATTWQVLKSTIPPEALLEDKPIYEKYRALEIAGKMTPKDAKDWATDSLNRLVKNKVNIYDVERKCMDQINLRGRAKELFELCAKENIPSIILSVSVKDLLEILCKHFGLNPSVILSTDAYLDDEGHMIGWDHESLIHAYNKRERGHSEVSRISSSRPFTILVGDSLPDAHMADGDEKVLRIRVYDPRKDEIGDRDKHIVESYKAGFDLVFEDSFDPVIKLIRSLTK